MVKQDISGQHRAPAPDQRLQQRVFLGGEQNLGAAAPTPATGGIDPQITGTSITPQATLTLQQQITNALTFTYIQDVTQSFGTDILRMKGIIAMMDDEQRFVIQGVHMLIEADRQRPWKPTELRQSRLVFIGRGLPRDALKQGFERCRA